MLKLKKGVRILGLRPETLLAIYAAETVYREVAGKDLVITSVTDGQHSRGSLHYQGNAFDARTRHLDAREKRDVTKVLRENLGQDFDVVLESTHLHIEFDPKEAYA